jgi:hypothetical protein
MGCHIPTQRGSPLRETESHFRENIRVQQSFRVSYLLQEVVISPYQIIELGCLLYEQRPPLRMIIKAL